MGIESNKEAVAMMKNALGSIENRFREAYNKGYKDGIKEGINQAMQKIADSILEEVEAEPQTKPPCDTCANKGDHDGECSNCVSDSETIRWKTPSHYKPKDESQPRCPKCGERGYIRSLESMGVKLKVFDEYRWKCTNCNKYFKEEPKDEPQTEEHCETCRHKDECEGATYEYKNTEWWCLAYAPIDEPQTDCAWK